MRVRAICDYYDLDLRKSIKTGDEFDVSEGRAKALSTVNNMARQKLVEIVEEAPKKAPTKKAAAKKKEAE